MLETPSTERAFVGAYCDAEQAAAFRMAAQVERATVSEALRRAMTLYAATVAADRRDELANEENG